MLVNHILGITINEEVNFGDISGDEVVNVVDIVQLVNTILGE